LGNALVVVAVVAVVAAGVRKVEDSEGRKDGVMVVGRTLDRVRPEPLLGKSGLQAMVKVEI
jgi:hypothetical protein